MWWRIIPLQYFGPEVNHLLIIMCYCFGFFIQYTSSYWCLFICRCCTPYLSILYCFLLFSVFLTVIHIVCYNVEICIIYISTLNRFSKNIRYVYILYTVSSSVCPLCFAWISEMKWSNLGLLVAESILAIATYPSRDTKYSYL